MHSYQTGIMTIFLKILLLATGLVTALITGLFYSYSCSVNPWLKKLSDIEYLRAMQSINRAILNPVFFMSFIGTLLLLPASAWMIYRNEGGSPSFYVMVTAALIYGIGVFGITIFGNIPLNDALDKFDTRTAQNSEIEFQRNKFETSWNRFHFIRTIACILSLLSGLGSIIMRLT